MRKVKFSKTEKTSNLEVAIFSTSEVSFDLGFIVTIDSRFVLPCLLLFIAYLFVQRNEATNV